MNFRLTPHVILPASLMNFLAGLYAAAGINILTTLEIGGASPHGPSAEGLGIDASAWIVAAVFQAWAAHIAENVDQEATLLIDPLLSEKERKDIRISKARKWARRFWIIMFITGLNLGVAIMLIAIPNMISPTSVPKTGAPNSPVVSQVPTARPLHSESRQQAKHDRKTGDHVGNSSVQH
jgi:hypothetical protein